MASELSTPEQELAAMSSVQKALGSIDPSSCGRVLRWAESRYGVLGDLQQVTFDWLLKLVKAVGEQAAKNKNPSDEDRELYKVLEGTRFAIKLGDS